MRTIEIRKIINKKNIDNLKVIQESLESHGFKVDSIINEDKDDIRIIIDNKYAICLYEIDIDKVSQNIHIFNGNYTFVKLDEDGNLFRDDYYLHKNEYKTFSINFDNFNIDTFLKEFNIFYSGKDINKIEKREVISITKDIYDRNLKVKKLLYDEINNQLGNISMKGGLATSAKLKHDFLWQDFEYNGIIYRLCLYTVSIDSKNKMVNIYHGNYTLQSDLRMANGRMPMTIMYKDTNSNDDIFTQANLRNKITSFNDENVDVDALLDEIKDYIGFKK